MSILGLTDTKPDTLAAVPAPKRIKKEDAILIITADKTQDLEFFYPYYRFIEEGYTVDVATPKGGSFAGKYGLGLKETKPIAEVRPKDYHLIYIPGGKSPQELRKNDEVLAFVREFAQSGKPIAAICHGPQVLISAGLVKGKQLAAWPEVRKEVEDAGGIYINEAFVQDGQFFTARMPGDLPRHLHGILHYLQHTALTQKVEMAKAPVLA